MKQEFQEIRTEAVEVTADDSDAFVPIRGPAEQLEEVLLAFRESVDGVRGVAIADRSGLPVAASFSTRPTS